MTSSGGPSACSGWGPSEQIRGASFSEQYAHSLLWGTGVITGLMPYDIMPEGLLETALTGAFLFVGLSELHRLLFQPFTPYLPGDGHDVVWPKALELILSLPFIVGVKTTTVSRLRRNRGAISLPTTAHKEFTRQGNKS